ncbi:ClpP-like prohead protease/major capsid protein fusion protein [Oleispirillum naphthae]|uniref:ClpP-like prohead protease/major capsid protein fusion protein n=1 Tax=Oleispirillum naphthae TaxID=2838853 RepID=UPI0030822063
MPKSIRRSWPGARGPYGYDMRMAVGNDAAVEIFVYGEIGWEVTAQSFLNDLRDVATPTTPLVVHINSVGGSVWEGLAIYNILISRAASVTTIVDGIALSMGSIIALAGKPTQMPANALMMIHDPSWYASGTPEEMRKQADVLDKIRDQLVGIYVAKSGQDEAEIRRMMAEETWLSGADAVALGLADELIEVEADLAAAAKFDLRNCRALPAPLRSLAASAAEPQPRSIPMPNTNPDAADPKTSANNPAPAPVDVADTAAIEAAANAAVAAERKRVADIGVACGAARMTDAFRDQMVAEGVSVADARARIIAELARLQAEGGPEPRSHIRAIVTDDAVDRFRAGMEEALLLRAGLGGERNEFSGLSLREMARAALDIRGIRSGSMNVLQMIGTAFVPSMAGGTHSTSDFANVLSNVANKAMLKGFTDAEETFTLWTGKGILTDFKPLKRIDAGLFDALAEVPEGAEYKYGTFGDRGETIQLATYGKMFSITRQAIINDDVGAFTRIPGKMGAASKRTIGNLVYAVLTSNAALSDGVALFHATHKNLASAGAAPSTATFDAMRTAMATQRDPDLKTQALNIRPAYVLAPVALEGKSKAVIASEFDSASGDKGLPNSVRDFAEVISDARLDIASTTAWYGAANPNVVDTIEVDYLDGVEEPYLESKDGWNVDGVDFKVRIDAGVKALDHRGLYKNAGV